jgi:hypothetical protein
MEVHRPRQPIRGTRDFLEEVGIIVLGVLIALAAEQTVEWMHWRYEVAEARAAFRSEMQGEDRKFAFRIAAESCVVHRLDALAQVTERVANHEAVPHLGPVQLDIANAYIDADWQAYHATSALTHLGHPELERYGAYYSQLEHVRDWIATEHEAWDELARLQGDPARLGAEDISTLRGALARARTANQTIARIATEEMQNAARLYVPSAGVDAQRLRAACAPLPIDVAAVAND